MNPSLEYSSALCYNEKGDQGRRARRYSILVKAHLHEDGPKNPLKGISMKLLVAAFYAQFRVVAGRIGLRAACNGIRVRIPLSFEASLCGYNRRCGVIPHRVQTTF